MNGWSSSNSNNKDSSQAHHSKSAASFTYSSAGAASESSSSTSTSASFPRIKKKYHFGIQKPQCYASMLKHILLTPPTINQDKHKHTCQRRHTQTHTCMFESLCKCVLLVALHMNNDFTDICETCKVSCWTETRHCIWIFPSFFFFTPPSSLPLDGGYDELLTM